MDGESDEPASSFFARMRKSERPERGVTTSSRVPNVGLPVPACKKRIVENNTVA